MPKCRKFLILYEEPDTYVIFCTYPLGKIVEFSFRNSTTKETNHLLLTFETVFVYELEYCENLFQQ